MDVFRYVLILLSTLAYIDLVGRRLRLSFTLAVPFTMARHLRFFETRVPQHDRTTGEVSIRKWKLLKAAVRSFWQTIRFRV